MCWLQRELDGQQLGLQHVSVRRRNWDVRQQSGGTAIVGNVDRVTLSVTTVN